MWESARKVLKFVLELNKIAKINAFKGVDIGYRNISFAFPTHLVFLRPRP